MENISEIIALVGTNGFAIVAWFFMYKMVTETLKELQTSVQEMTIAVTKLTAQLRGDDE